MTDPRLDRYAHLICEHSLGIDASHRLLINGPREGSPLMVATAREAWRRGARVSVDMAADWVVTDVLRHGSDAQVAYLDPAELEMVDGFDRWLFVWAPGNAAERAGIAESRDAARARAQQPWMARHDEREAAGELRWVGAAYPTALGAQNARMGTQAWERFVYAALMLDQPDPVAAWRSLIDRHARLIERLSGVRELRVVSAGTDLRVHVDGRAWESCAGEANLPDGEVFCSPPLDGVEGEITFDVPSRHDGRECRDVRLRFEAGVVVDASASFGEDVLLGASRHGRGRAPRRRVRDRHERDDHARRRRHALRREDRRHVPPRARPLVSHAGRREHLGDPLGHGLRPARRRAHRGRRRAPAGGREAGRLMDPFDDLYARVIVEHALAVRAGQTVLVEGGEASEPLARAVFRRVLEAGGHPTVQMLPDGWIETKAESASDEVLAEADPLKLTWYRQIDCRVTLLALANVEQLAHVPPARAAASETGRLRAVHVLLDRDSRGEAAWCGAQYPTAAYAQAAGLSLDGYRELLARALKLDQPDPIVAWREQGERQDRLVSQLEQVDELRIVAEGTDLRVRVGGRRWISASGRHNLPDGEVFTGPREDATEGVVSFRMPSAWGGQRVEGARLRFEAGRCVEADAASGGEFLRAALDTDDGARTLGEFAFGLNEAVTFPTLDTLLDEKMGGTVHMALGSAYAVTGGTNQSALHWDLVCDLREGGEVYADGTLIQRDGRFLGNFA